MSNDSRMSKLMTDLLHEKMENRRLRNVDATNCNLRKEVERLSQVIRDVTGDDDLAPRYSKNRLKLLVRMGVE